MTTPVSLSNKQDRQRTYNVTQWCIRVMFIPLLLS